MKTLELETHCFVMKLKKARRQLAEDKQTKDMDYWNHFLWSDETEINLLGSDEQPQLKVNFH